MKYDDVRSGMLCCICENQLIKDETHAVVYSKNEKFLVCNDCIDEEEDVLKQKYKELTGG
jgi:hypothetical protein